MTNIGFKSYFSLFDSSSNSRCITHNVQTHFHSLSFMKLSKSHLILDLKTKKKIIYVQILWRHRSRKDYY